MLSDDERQTTVASALLPVHRTRRNIHAERFEACGCQACSSLSLPGTRVIRTTGSSKNLNKFRDRDTVYFMIQWSPGYTIFWIDDLSLRCSLAVLKFEGCLWEKATAATRRHLSFIIEQLGLLYRHRYYYSLPLSAATRTIHKRPDQPTFFPSALTMKLSNASLLLAVFVASANAYTTPTPPTTSSSTTTSRRQWMNTATTALAAPLVASFGLPTLANAAGTEVFNDVTHGFSIAVPSDWTKQEQTLNDRRTITVWTDPKDPKTALFIAYTPIRDDFTSLSSFGSVDVVAAQTILPKGAIGGNDGVTAKMLSAESKKSAYIFDYTQAIENVQPATHFRTIFSLAQGATGGAGAVLVTITLQTPEENYAGAKTLFDSIIDSYGKNK